jgi:HK97 family phage prohead protease
MNTKSLAHIEVKDEDKGQITAVFATLNVVDSDGDVTLPGAFENGAKVRISAFGHRSWDGALPVGKGTIREVKDEAILDGQFFLDTPEGRSTFAVVKSLGEDGLQEFSYGYDPVEFSYGEHDDRPVRFLKKLKVHEVSPVLLGAGVGTRLLSAKGGLKFSEHIAAVVADVDALAARATEVMALRAEKGKALGAASADLLARLDASVKRLSELLAGAAEPPVTDNHRDELDRLYAAFVASTQGA